MENTTENLGLHQINQSHLPLSSCSLNVALQSEKPSLMDTDSDIEDNKDNSVCKIDIRNLPELRISLERIRYPYKISPKTACQEQDKDSLKCLDDEDLQNNSNYEDLRFQVMSSPVKVTPETSEAGYDTSYSMVDGDVRSSQSDSENSFETIVLSEDSNDAILDVNQGLQLMDVKSDSESTDSNNQDDVISSIASEDGDSEASLIVHDLSNIFVPLERLSIPNRNVQDVQEKTDQNEDNKLEKKVTTVKSLLPMPIPYVLLERIEVQTVTSKIADLPSPSSSYKKPYMFLPEATVRIERIPQSVFRKYGIVIQKDNTVRPVREDQKMYCVLGLKLLLQKRKQQNLFEQRVSELRDFVIPMRNNTKLRENAKRKMKRERQRLRNLPSKMLNFCENSEVLNVMQIP